MICKTVFYFIFKTYTVNSIQRNQCEVVHVNVFKILIWQTFPNLPSRSFSEALILTVWDLVNTTFPGLLIKTCAPWRTTGNWVKPINQIVGCSSEKALANFVCTRQHTNIWFKGCLIQKTNTRPATWRRKSQVIVVLKPSEIKTGVLWLFSTCISFSSWKTD